MSEVKPNELESLKQFCDNANIPYHANISLAKLKEKVQMFHDEQAKRDVKRALDNQGASEIEKIRQDALKLIRVRVACMDPNKQQWEGEYLTTGNSVVGTVTRMIPFGIEWHVEQILFNMMKDQKFRQSYDVPDGQGGKTRKNRFVPSYSIEVLPPLSEQELSELAHQQATRGSVKDD